MITNAAIRTPRATPATCVTTIEPEPRSQLGLTRPAFGLAVADLVGFLRDRAPDPASPQVGAVRAGAVGLVGQHPAWPGARPPADRPGNPDAPQHDLELRAVTALPRGDHHGQ